MLDHTFLAQHLRTQRDEAIARADAARSMPERLAAVSEARAIARLESWHMGGPASAVAIQHDLHMQQQRLVEMLQRRTSTD